jgi:predicted metal-dependent phosphotriesterase family hydrolase
MKMNPYAYLYIKKVIFPQLQELGVSDTVINNLCINGPRNFFEGSTKKGAGSTKDLQL